MRKYFLFDVVPKAHHCSEGHDITTRSTIMLGCLSPDRQAQQRDRQRHRRVASLLVLLFPLTLGSCYWLKYGKLMRTHVDLLLSMARKMNDLLEDHRTITPSTIDEFSYPLERARDFVHIVSRRYAERRSLQAFNHFLDTYAALVEEMERLRALNEDMSDLRKRLVTLQEQGEQVKSILAEEEM